MASEDAILERLFQIVEKQKEQEIQLNLMVRRVNDLEKESEKRKAADNQIRLTKSQENAKEKKRLEDKVKELEGKLKDAVPDSTVNEDGNT